MRISDWSSDVCSSDLSQGEIIADKAQLVEYLEAGCKPAEAWRIGTEHEKFCYALDDFRPLPYAGERSIRALLEGLQRFGWAPVAEEIGRASCRKECVSKCRSRWSPDT